MIRYLLIIVLLYTSSCTQNKQPGRTDVRQKMYDVISKNEDFYNDEVKITSFVHIGEVNINGQEYHVAWIRAVIRDMFCPRGLSHLVFFDKNYNLAKEPYFHSIGNPLWCNHNRIYFNNPQDISGCMLGTVLVFKENCHNGKYELMIENNDGSLVSGYYDPDEK